MDLSKAFATLNHNLLVAKLKAYGLDSNALLKIDSNAVKLVTRFVNRKIAEIPQGSILGTLLSNIFINDIFSIYRLRHL